MSRTLSLPHEHGGYLTIAGATAAGVGLAHARAPSLAIGVVVAAAFFARAPVEELLRGRGARLDGIAVATLTAIMIGAALALGGAWAAVALVVAGTTVCGSWFARRARWHRAMWFETLGMTALGASAGLIALAGGAEPHTATALAIVIGMHTGLAVPLVRTEVRPRERVHARRAAWSALAVLLLGALALALVGRGWFAVALTPRAVHALARMTSSSSRSHPNVVGVRESAMLALVIIAVLGR